MRLDIHGPMGIVVDIYVFDQQESPYIYFNLKKWLFSPCIQQGGTSDGLDIKSTPREAILEVIIN